MGKRSSISTFFRKVTALVLSIQLLVSVTGFSFSAHYCGNELRSWSINGETEACEMPAMKEIKCPSHEGMVIQVPNSCCNDQKISVDRIEFDASLIKAEAPQFTWTTPQVSYFSFDQKFPNTKQKDPVSVNRPPPVDREIFILVQSFLL